MARMMVVPLVAAAALFMENMDATVIATSLPAIARDLNEDPVILKLAFTSYLIALAVFIPISGWAADRYGARNVFRGAIVVFTLASAACGLANSLEWLVAARAAQGIGGAMMTPVGRLILLRSVPKNQLVQALAYLTVPALIAPVIGPPLGGFITTYFQWRWIFWINIPVGVLGLVLASLYMPDLKAEKMPPLDIAGFLMSGIGLSSVIFGFTVMGRDMLPSFAAPALVIFGTLLIALYIRHARRTPHPILDLSLLNIPTFRQSMTGGTLFRMTIGAIPFLLPLLLQVGFGLDPFASGSLTFAAAAGAMLMKLTAGTDPAPFRIPQRAYPQRPHLRRLHGDQRDLHALHAAFADHRDPARGRLLPLSPIHQPECARLCRYPHQRHRPSHQHAAVSQQMAAAAGVALGAFLLEIAALAARRHEPGDRRFLDRIPRPGRADANSPPTFISASPRTPGPKWRGVQRNDRAGIRWFARSGRVEKAVDAPAFRRPCRNRR